jgi:transcriptional regulator with XRE-family HTH domain
MRKKQRFALDSMLGQNIRLKRYALNVTQTALATSIGVGFQQIQKYESGANRIGFSRLVEIARALECRVADLIGDLDGDPAADHSVFLNSAHLRQTGAARLLTAFAELKPSLRKRVLELVVELARDQRRRATGLGANTLTGDRFKRRSMTASRSELAHRAQVDGQGRAG